MDDDLCYICRENEQEVLWNHDREGVPWIAVCEECDDNTDVEDYFDMMEETIIDEASEAAFGMTQAESRYW